MTTPAIAVVYYSGSGHTTVLAEAVEAAAAEAGADSGSKVPSESRWG